MKTTIRALCLALLLTGCTGTDVRTADSLLPPQPAAVPSLPVTLVEPTLPPLLPPTPSPPPRSAAPTEPPVRWAARVGRVRGVVTDTSGRPLMGIQVWRGDLTAELAVTDHQGRYEVPCGRPLLLSAREIQGPPDAQGNIPRGPGTSVGNYAWRRVPTRTACGRVLRTALPTGGVVEGIACADSERHPDYCRRVTLARMTQDANGHDVYYGAGQPAFTVAADEAGHYRVDGLAAGIYHIEESVEGFPDEGTAVGVSEGQTSDGTFSVYVHEFPCEPDPPCPGP